MTCKGTWPHHQAQVSSSCMGLEHLGWTRDQWDSVLFSGESWFTWPEMTAANDIGDIKGSAMHQPLLSPDKPLVVVLQCGQVCIVSTELPYTLWMVQWKAHTTWITSLIQSLGPCMNNIGLTSSSWTTILQFIEVSSLGNGNFVPQNLNDLTAALQEEWDAMPQQTISRLVNSMRRRCQAVIDTQG